MSEAALKTVQRQEQIETMLRTFVKQNFPEMALDGVEITARTEPAQPVKKLRTPDDVAKELVDVLFPDLQGDFSAPAMHRRSIATITIKQWAHKLVEEFREAIDRGETRNKELHGLIKLAKEAMLTSDLQIQELQSNLRQAEELRGVHADKAKDELGVKLANSERNHATDQRLLQLALAERDEARAELVGQKAKYDGLERDHQMLMTAVSGNAEAPKKADQWLAAAVEKCHEFWGENARRSPTAQLVLTDIIKARVALQPLTLVNGKTEQSKTA